MLFLAWAFALVQLVPTLLQPAAAAPPVIAQYWPAYSSTVQPPAAIRWKATHIAYYFVTVTTATGFEVGGGQPLSEITDFVTNAHTFNSKAVFALGGWTGSRYFSSLVSSAGKRLAFARQLKAFSDQYDFDGIDLDWEYPNAAGIGCNQRAPEDSAILLAFIKTLRTVFGANKLITAAVSVTPFARPDGTPRLDVSSFGIYLDYINLMTYDISGPWSATTGPNSPLQRCGADSSVATAVDAWVSRGFPAAKILVGIPSYAYSYTTLSATLTNTTFGGFDSQIYQAKSSVIPQGDSRDSFSSGTDQCGNSGSGFSGQWHFNTMVTGGILSRDGLTGLKGYTRYWDACTSTPFLFNPSNKRLIIYDDAQSSAAKAEYAMSRGLGGVMIFDSTGFTLPVFTAMQQKLGLRNKT